MRFSSLLAFFLLGCSAAPSIECTDYGGGEVAIAPFRMTLDEVDALRAACETWRAEGQSARISYAGGAIVARAFESAELASRDRGSYLVYGESRTGLLLFARERLRDGSDLEATLAHEIGHLLGLGHVRGSGHLMSPNPLPSGGKLDPWDREALRFCRGQ